MKKTLVILFAFLLMLLPAAAKSPFAVRAESEAYNGQPAIKVSFDVPADHHLYSSFSVTDTQDTPLAPLSVPEPDPQKPEDFEASYSAPFAAFYAPPAGGGDITVTYQGCAGTLCYMPETVTFSIRADDEDRAPLPPDSGADDESVSEPVSDDRMPDLPAARGEPSRLIGYQPADTFLAFLERGGAPVEDLSAWQLFQDDPAQFYLQHGIVLSVLLILAGGFLLNLTPCVLPMIPVNLAIIGATSADASKGTRFGLGLVYGLGMALVYGTLGLVVILSGSVFGALNASPLFNGFIAILFLMLALAMFDVWQLDFSRFRRNPAMTGKIRIPAVLVLGGISALLAGACVAPVLIAVLALSGSLYAQGVTGALFLPFLLGVGMALPWPLAAAGMAILPKPGAWMTRVKKAFGVLILLLALFYGWNAVKAFQSLPDMPEAESTEAPAMHRIDLTQNPEGFAPLLAEALASGKPILMDFGAHWCKTCKLMDRTTLVDPAVADKLQNKLFAIQILADHPNESPAKELLQPFPVQGYPTFLLYPAP